MHLSLELTRMQFRPLLYYSHVFVADEGSVQRIDARNRQRRDD